MNAVYLAIFNTFKKCEVAQMGMKHAIIFILAAILIVPCISAQAAFNISYHIADEKVVTNGQAIFEQPYTGNITLSVPIDAVTLAVYADDKIQPMRIEEQFLTLSLKEARKLRWSYSSKSYLERNAFVANMLFPFDTDIAHVKLTLPEKAVLEKAVTSTSGSVFPRPTNLITDGQAMTLIWQKRDVKQGEEFPVYVTYEMPSFTFLYTIIGIVFALFIIGIISYYTNKALRKHRHAVKALENPQTQEGQKQAKSIETYLKDDEQQVLQILKQREGQCDQGTLRVITGFSKAKLSSLLKELEDRRIIFREKRGKKNLVFLKEL